MGRWSTRVARSRAASSIAALCLAAVVAVPASAAGAEPAPLCRALSGPEARLEDGRPHVVRSRKVRCDADFDRLSRLATGDEVVLEQCAVVVPERQHRGGQPGV